MAIPSAPAAAALRIPAVISSGEAPLKSAVTTVELRLKKVFTASPYFSSHTVITTLPVFSALRSIP